MLRLEGVRSTTLTERQPATSSSRDALDVYLDGTRRHERLTSTQERAALKTLQGLREARWIALTSCPSLARAALTWMGPCDDCSDEALRQVVLEAVDALQHRPTTTRAGALQTALQDFAEAMAVRGAGAADSVCEQVDRYATGRSHALPGLGPNLRDEAVFGVYLRRCRQARSRYLRARNDFLSRNLRLVVTIAQRYGKRRMSLADRVQEGNIGLISAVERFDVDRGTRFSTYAAWWIRHCVTRALINHGRTVRVPAHLQRIFYRARRVYPELQRSLGRPPRVDETAQYLGVTVQKLQTAEEALAMYGVALDDPMPNSGPENSRPVSDVLAAESVPFDRHIDDERHLRNAATALDELGTRERHILTRRFGLDGDEPSTLRGLGERYDVSRERIRQLQSRAIDRLRKTVCPPMRRPLNPVAA